MNIEHCLYVGRFQPFHFGHLSVVQAALKTGQQLIIGIGSAEDSFLPDNPFTAGERFQMIQESLKSEGISAEKYTIIPIRNINNYALWVRHVEMLVPTFQVVYTASPIVKKLFLEDGKYEVREAQKIIPVTATLVRQKMLRGDETWKKDVPEVVVRKIKTINGVERIQAINN